MVKDLAELQVEAAKWSEKAIAELKTQMEKFMREHDATPEKVAEILGWKVKKVNAILEGIGDLRITDLATLLVATNQVLCVMPAKETPVSYGSIPDVPEVDEEEDDVPEWDDDEEDDDDDTPEWDNDEKEEEEEEQPRKECCKGKGFGLIGINISDNPEAAKLIEGISKVLKESGLADVLGKMLGKQ